MFALRRGGSLAHDEVLVRCSAVCSSRRKKHGKAGVDRLLCRGTEFYCISGARDAGPRTETAQSTCTCTRISARAGPDLCSGMGAARTTGGPMSTSFTVHTFALAAGLACAAGAYAADTSTERTTMPDYCTQRDVNCVMPDNTTPIRSAV